MELVVALSLRDEASVPRCHLEHTFIRDVTLAKMSGRLKIYSGFQLFLFLFFMYGCSTYMYVCEPSVCNAQEGQFVRHFVGAGNQALVLWKSSSGLNH